MKPPSEEQKALSAQLNALLDTALSLRELECLAITLAGFSAKHIGEQLHISHRTVETHLQKAYQKVGCSGKQHCLEIMYANQTLVLWWDLCKVLLHLENPY